MKTQLLQDIDESGSKSGPQPPPALPTARLEEGASLIERAALAPRPAGPASAPAAAPAAVPAPAPESASEPAPPPMPRPTAAVWRRPQAPLAPSAAAATQSRQDGTFGASMQRAYDPRYGEARVPPPRPAVAESAFASRDAVPPVPPVPPIPPVPPVRDPAPEAAIPDWLNERLREDAQREERAQWSSQWKRRLATWSMAGGLLAIVAAGGLWVYEDNRVDGALGVVAQTSPGQAVAPPVHVLKPAPVEVPPAAQVPVPQLAHEPVPEPAPAAASVPAPTEVPPTTAAQAGGALPAIAGGAAVLAATAGATRSERSERSETDPSAAAPPAPAANAQPAAATERKSAPPAVRRGTPRRQLAQADKPRRAAAAPVAAEPSARQRREETLMQCRAHGYDQRQCDRRGCVMTSFGFACKG